MNQTISFQIAPGSFYGMNAWWIYEFAEGALQRHFGPYWNLASAQDQIKSWALQEARVKP